MPQHCLLPARKIGKFRYSREDEGKWKNGQGLRGLEFGRRQSPPQRQGWRKPTVISSQSFRMSTTSRRKRSLAHRVTLPMAALLQARIELCVSISARATWAMEM